MLQCVYRSSKRVQLHMWWTSIKPSVVPAEAVCNLVNCQIVNGGFDESQPFGGWIVHNFIWICKYIALFKRNKVWVKSGRSAVKLQHSTATHLAALSEHDWFRRCEKRTFFLSIHSLYKLWPVQEVERQSQKLSYEMHREKMRQSI